MVLIVECRDEILYQKTRIMGLPDGEEIITLAFFVLTKYRCVTEGLTDGWIGMLLLQRPSLA